jgi:hypothetical protein
MEDKDRTQSSESEVLAEPPAKLADKRLPLISVSRETDPDVTDRGVASEPFQDTLGQERSSFANHVHAYLQGSIRFADQKAGFLFAAATAVIAVLFKQDLLEHWRTPVGEWSLGVWAAAIASILVGVSGLISIGVVTPRLGGRSGLVYWGTKEVFVDVAAWRTAVFSLDANGLAGHVVDHCFELRAIARRKHGLLRWASWLFVGGLIPTIVFLISP